MRFRIIRKRAFEALLLTASIFYLQFSPDVYASVADDCKGKNYQPNIVPDHMGVREKKHRFRCLVEADLDAVYFELSTQYLTVLNAVNQSIDNQQLKRWRLKYGVESNQELLIAIKPHPRSITIAQGAIESAWGTSRIFIEANNIFGIRPFSKDEPRIAASKKRGDKTVWLRKYVSIRESISDYYLVLGRASAYREFRNMKMETTDPHQLVGGLSGYSERKTGYVKELSSIIRYNNFHELDL
jgi:Bax protein